MKFLADIRPLRLGKPRTSAVVRQSRRGGSAKSSPAVEQPSAIRIGVVERKEDEERKENSRLYVGRREKNGQVPRLRFGSGNQQLFTIAFQINSPVFRRSPQRVTFLSPLHKKYDSSRSRSGFHNVGGVSLLSAKTNKILVVGLIGSTIGGPFLGD